MDLSNLINQKKMFNQLVEEQTVINIAIQIFMALKYLHDQDYLHRDVKSSNILLKGKECKLVDFGSVRQLNSKLMPSSLHGTPLYAAPEMHKEELYSKPVDIWSFGVVLYELCTQ